MLASTTEHQKRGSGEGTRDHIGGVAARTLAAMALLGSLVTSIACAGPGDEPRAAATAVQTEGSISVRGDVWADNWFALYLGDKLIIEDSVPITTERSFNAESFEFNADYPFQLNFVLKDFKENDTGLEYIGSRRQQMGDGGFIAQFVDTASDRLLAASSSDWRCLVVHQAPLDKACADASDPIAGVAPCTFSASEEPEGWKEPGFDDSHWISPTEFSSEAVRPKQGYDEIQWHSSAQLIWTGDLETDNTILCRTAISAPQ